MSVHNLSSLALFLLRALYLCRSVSLARSFLVCCLVYLCIPTLHTSSFNRYMCVCIFSSLHVQIFLSLARALSPPPLFPFSSLSLFIMRCPFPLEYLHVLCYVIGFCLTHTYTSTTRISSLCRVFFFFWLRVSCVCVFVCVCVCSFLWLRRTRSAHCTPTSPPLGFRGSGLGCMV